MIGIRHEGATMSEAGSEYRFVIETYSPETMPASRLAEYMTNLGRLFGENEHMHFVRLECGSTALVQAVESEGRVQNAKSVPHHYEWESPDDAARAFRSLNGRLAADNATDVLRESGGAEIIRFPGHEQPQPVKYGPYNQLDTLDGILIRIDGRDDTTLHCTCTPEGWRYDPRVCNTTRSMAIELAPNLYGPVLRVHGDAR